MDRSATGANVDRPARSRAFLEHWADSNRVDRLDLERLFRAADRWAPGAPLMIPGLDGRTFYDPQSFSWTEDLTRMGSALRSEIAEFSTELAPHPESAALVEQGGWHAWFLWRSGQPLEPNAICAPVAAKAVGLAPGGGQAGNAYYSLIDPGTRLRRHTGPFNGRLRCHLGLDVPGKDCEIEIAGERQSWRNDECLIFNDLPPHSVVNDSVQRRTVFVIDFWHPELTEDERNALSALLADGS
jgi:aspartate beta-hydroxylase